MYEQEDVRNVSRVGSIRPIASQQTTQSWDPQIYHDEMPNFRMFDAIPCFPIEVLIKKTNVPLITLRAWERYYGLPSPWSDQQTVKLYSQRDIEVVRWLREQVATTLSIRQAMDILVRHEPAYAVDRKVRASRLLVPPRREISEIRDLLMQAIVSINKASATRLLADAFATYPARLVCQQVLQPVLNYAVTLQRENTITEAAKAFAFSLVHLQFNHLIEACLSPKGASQYLYSLLTQSQDYVGNAAFGELRQSTDRQERRERAPFDRPDRTISSLGVLENMLYSALSAMNGSTARDIINTAFLYYPVKDVCILLLQCVLQRMKELIKTDQSPDSWTNFSVRLIQQTLFQHFQSTPNLRRGLPIIVGCAPSETNEIHALMVALFWRTAGRHVYYLGQTLNAEGIFFKLQRLPCTHPAIIYLSAQSTPRITDVIAVGQILNRMGQQRPLICFGGSPFTRAHSQSQQTPGIYLGTRVTTVDRSMGDLLRLCTTLSLSQVEELVGGSLLTNFRDETKAHASFPAHTGDLRSTSSPPSIELIGKTPLAPESGMRLPTTEGIRQAQGSKRAWVQPKWQGTRYYPGSTEIRKALPGLLCVVFPLAGLTEIIWSIELALHQSLFADVFIAAILALLVGNFLTLPEYIQPGLVFCTRWFLRPGIILAALNFSASFLLQFSLPGLLLALTSTVIAFIIAIGGGTFLKVPPRTSVLIGTGAASGGVSAVMALAPTLRARDEEIAVALGTILFWGTIGLFFYPLAELLAHLGPVAYGVWTGATLPDFAQLVAATQQGGGAQALKFALAVKLLRVILGTMIICIMRLWTERKPVARQEYDEEETGQRRPERTKKVREILRSVPVFIPVLVVVVVLNTLIPLPDWLTGPLATWPATTFPTTVATLLFIFAIIGICTRVTRASVKIAGLNTIVLGMCTWIIQAIALFVLTALLFHLY